MVERGSAQDHLHASLLAFQGGITVPGYAASKGAIGQLTKALANEWAGKGVQVNAIAPGTSAPINHRVTRRPSPQSGHSRLVSRQAGGVSPTTSKARLFTWRQEHPIS